MPSACSRSTPKVAARSTKLKEAEARSTRVPMPYWLFTTANRTGSFQRAAMFSDS